MMLGLDVVTVVRKDFIAAIALWEIHVAETFS